MSFATPAIVISGKAYQVQLVSDRTPANLADFVDADEFALDMDGTAYRVQGSGRLVDGDVRFHEKDIKNSGKDIRVWRVIRHDDGSFLANHAAAF